MPSSLRDCIDDALAGTTAASLTRNVERLIDTYRSGKPPVTPILATPDDVLAYTAYRMPATYAVASAALRQLQFGVPDLQPRTLIDFGAGTGAVELGGRRCMADAEPTSRCSNNRRPRSSSVSASCAVRRPPSCKARHGDSGAFQQSKRTPKRLTSQRPLTCWAN